MSQGSQAGMNAFMAKAFGPQQGFTRSISGPQEWQTQGFGSAGDWQEHQQFLRDREKSSLFAREKLQNQLLSGGGSFGMGDYRERANALIDQMGGADRLRINRGFDAAEQGALANLSDRGLGGSSSSANISLGTERERQQALTGVEDQLLGRRLGVEDQLFGQQADLYNQLLGGIFS